MAKGVPTAWPRSVATGGLRARLDAAEAVAVMNIPRANANPHASAQIRQPFRQVDNFFIRDRTAFAGHVGVMLKIL
jgi:hypothetical protein